MVKGSRRKLSDKYAPFLLAVLILFSISGYAQTYNPSAHVVINDALGPAQATPTDSRSMFYDISNFIYRDYQSTTEVKTYLNLSKYRTGGVPIYVHLGGSLSGGVWTGGIRQVWWFKNGSNDSNLVRWATDSSSSCSGCLLSANNLSDLANSATSRTNLGLGNVDNTSDATKNAAVATLTNKTISGANNTITNIPNSALNNSTIGVTLGTSGSDFGVTGTPASLGGSFTFNFPVAGPGVTGKLSGSDWSTFNNKLSNITGLLTGGSGYTLNGLGTSVSPYSLTITGSGGTCIGCNADSLKNLPVDTTLRRNGYALTFDSTNHKWVLAPNGSGTGISGLTGDGTASGSGTVTFTLSTVNGSPGSFGSASNVPAFTVNGKGLVTTVTNTPIQISESQVTNLTTDLASKISLTSLSATSPLAYNNSTGVFSIQVANTSQNGYLSSTDWNTFNTKQAALSGTGYLKFSGTTPSYLTPTQVTADLNLFTSSLKGLVPLSGGGTANFLRADGTWAAPPGGGGTPDTIHLFSYGTGRKILSTDIAGDTLFNRTFENSTTVSWGLNADSSIFSTSLLTPTGSLTNSGANWSLVNDNASPGNNFLYGTSTIGTKGWLNFFSLPLASSSQNGLLSSSDYNLLHFTQYVVNLGTPGDDSVFTSSLAGDSLYGIRKKFVAGSGIAISKTGSTFGEDVYTFSTTGGAGNTNSNVGSGFRLAFPNTNNIRTLFCAGCTLDSTTNTNALTITVTAGGSGTVTSFSAGTLSPLFTTSVATATTTPALTFALSNAAANTAFGNFTGSSAAPAFGKVTVAAFATGTANTLIGYDGSGNPSGITVSTGLSLSSGILTSTATIPTFQQTLTQGSTLTTNNTINQAAHNFIWSGGGVMQFDSTKYTAGYTNPVFGTGATNLTSFGNSITFGLNATVRPDSAYVGRLARNLNLVLSNFAVSGTQVGSAIALNLANINPGHTSITTFCIGFNDLRNFTGTTVFNAVNDGYGAAIINQYLTSFLGAGDASITRYGSWNSPYNVALNGNGKATNGAYTSNQNDSLVLPSITRTTIAVELLGTTAGASNCVVYIDNTIVDSVILSSQAALANYTPLARVYVGLSNTSHKVKLVAHGGSGLMIVDYIGTVSATPILPIIAFDVPYMSFAGTVNGSSTKIRVDTLNNRIAATVTYFRGLGFPVFEAKTNNFYTATVGVDLSSDSIHPNDLGHYRIYQAGVAALSAASFTAGTITYSNDGHFYGSNAGQLNQLAYKPDINLQTVLNNGATLLGPMNINGNGYPGSLSSFTTLTFDSLFFIKNTGVIGSSLVSVRGQFKAFGSAAALQVGQRNNDTTKFFQWYAQSGALITYDAFNGRDLGFIDTSFRTRLYNDVNSHVVNNNTSQNLLNAVLYLDGNRAGLAGRAPLKLDSGVLISTPERGAIEFNGLHLYVTDRTGTRFQLDQQSGGSGVTTVGTLSGSSIANGASIASTTITFGPADGTNPGMVTTGTQTFAGTKTFSSAPVLTTTSTVGQVWTASGTGGQGGWAGASNIYNANGTLSSNRTLTMGTNNLIFSGFNSGDGYIYLQAPVCLLYNTSPGDANYTIVQENVVMLKTAITANRNLTFPDANLYTGRVLYINNENTSAFIWNLVGSGTGNTIKDPAGNVISSMESGTDYIFISDTQGWRAVSTFKSSGSPIKYQHTIFTPTTGGTVSLVNNQYNIINPTGALATLTVNLPSSPLNNDVVYIKYTQTVSVVTYGNGTVVDGITAPVAGGVVVLTYDAGTTSWY